MHLFRAFAYEQTIAEQQAEIERLRAALFEIASLYIVECDEIVNRALNEQKIAEKE